MSRPLRIQYPGAYYHVMNRGTAWCPTFLEPENDRNLFKWVLSETVQTWKIKIHAYALMSNHYHLLIETPLANLSRAIKHIDGLYTQQFNRRHERDGPLFRGRFKSILMERETYLLELVRYIHMNGVQAGLYSAPRLDPHTSHRDYLATQHVPPWLCRDEVLAFFRSQGGDPQAQLDRFVRGEIPADIKKILSQKRWPAILGSPGYVSDITKRFLQKMRKDPEQPEMVRILSKPLPQTDEITRIVKQVYFGASYDRARMLDPQMSRELKWALIFFLRRQGHLSWTNIGKSLGDISYSGVVHFLNRYDFSKAPRIQELSVMFQESLSHVKT